MLLIALSFIISALWIILSPWNQIATEILLVTILIMLGLWSLISIIRKHSQSLATALFLLTGILSASLIYPNLLKEYREIEHSLPLQIEGEFHIIRNHYPTSTTIQLHKITTPNLSQQLAQDLQEAEVVLYNISPDIKRTLQEGALYHASIEIKPRIIRNIPGYRERILSYLARKAIGYGKLKTDPILIASPDRISQLRTKIADYLSHNYSNSAYLSALSVGKTDELTQYDWQTLRRTGTIHLVSISGLHLSLTAFYAFILFRILFGLLQIRRIPPFRLAALLSIIIAWSYALLAGMSLPTIRAAIMFSVAMIALLINRPIFSLHSVALALVIILLWMPLALLTAGFWLSFVAVITLTLSTRLFQSPIKALLLTQLVLSMLLIPLTASFFGEISLISPIINLIAIPWTSIMIMPMLLIGVTLYLIAPPIFADPFLRIADQGITVLKYLIMQSARLPYASIEVSQMPLSIAVFITLLALVLLYQLPILRQKVTRFSNISYRYLFLKKVFQFFKQNGQSNIRSNPIRLLLPKYSIMPLIVITLLITLFFFIKYFVNSESHPFFQLLWQQSDVRQYTIKPNNPDISEQQITSYDTYDSIHHTYSTQFDDTESTHVNDTILGMLENHITPNFQLSMYQLPVGEGLSFLLTASDFTLLFDTGNRFRQFDAGKNIIHPTLRNLNITNIDYLILSKRNQQHIGGTQSVLTAYPDTPVWTLPNLQIYINNAGNCRKLQHIDRNYIVKPLPTIQSSCAFHITLYGMIDLYLIADIENLEWPATLKYIETIQQQMPDRQVVLLYPNQGRRYFPIHSLFTNIHNTMGKEITINNDSTNNSTSNLNPPIILFSTRLLNPKITSVMKQYQQPIYNSYQSTIALHFNYKKTKSLLELRLEDYQDQYRYYWLQPIQ